MPSSLPVKQKVHATQIWSNSERAMTMLKINDSESESPVPHEKDLQRYPAEREPRER